MVNVTAPIITLAFVFDKSFHWAESIMNYTIQMLNNRTDSWYDDIFGDGTVVEGRFALADCDGTDAADAYWDIRERFGGVAPMGCVGARCSQSTMALGVVTTVENVPLVSPASNSPILSDKEQYVRNTSLETVRGLNALVSQSRGHRSCSIHVPLL
jgi:hypothetical protein